MSPFSWQLYFLGWQNLVISKKFTRRVLILNCISGFFFQHFYGSGCSWSLPVRWVLKLKSLSFFSKCLSFFPTALEFFQYTEIWGFGVGFLKKTAMFCEKFVKNGPNIAFFGALRANKGSFGLFTAKILKINWVLKSIWLLSLPVRWVLGWKILEFFGPLSFFGLEFFRKC